MQLVLVLKEELHVGTFEGTYVDRRSTCDHVGAFEGTSGQLCKLAMYSCFQMRVMLIYNSHNLKLFWLTTSS